MGFRSSVMADLGRVRRREEDLRGQLARVASPDDAEPRRVLVGRVVDGGNLPTTVPRVYLVEPDQVAVESGLTEGATPTLTPIEGSVPVLVLGPTVPGVGSALTARLVEGIWVSGSSVQAPCPEGVETSLTIRVARYCNPGNATPQNDLWIEGATVTVSDQDEVYPPRVGTTDASGYTTIVLDGPGTFLVRVDLPSPSDCQLFIEGGEILECEQRTLPTVSPCCGEVCVEVFDYDTGLPIEGATITVHSPTLNETPQVMGVTDSEGVLCFSPRRTMKAGATSIVATKDGYFQEHVIACEDCNCEDTVQYAIALFPSSVFVPWRGPLGLNASWTLAQCPPPEDCFDRFTHRFPYIYRRVMYADFAGPGPIFGGDKTGIPLTYIGNGIWEGLTTGGYGIRRRITRTGPATWETTNSRYDFPVARVRVRFEQIPPNFLDPARTLAWLEWRNYLDAAGTIVPVNDYILGGTGNPFTGPIGTWRESFWHESICLPENLFRYYPSTILNARCLEPSDPANDQPCSVIWNQFGRVNQVEGLGANNSGPCAPVDLSGLYWCSRANICTEYGSPLSATFALYE